MSGVNTLKAIDLSKQEAVSARGLLDAMIEQARLLMADIGLGDLSVLPIRVQRRTVSEPLLRAVLHMLTSTAALGVDNGRVMLGPAAGVDIDWTLPDRNAAQWARQHGLSLVKDINAATADRLKIAVADAIEQGQSVHDLARRIVAEDGALGAARAQAIAVTETTNAHAVGNQEAWKAAGVWGNEWVTASDDLVCPICRPNHGKVRKLGNPFPSGHVAPAGHPRCRCGLNPVVDEEPEN